MRRSSKKVAALFMAVALLITGNYGLAEIQSTSKVKAAECLPVKEMDIDAATAKATSGSSITGDENSVKKPEKVTGLSVYAHKKTKSIAVIWNAVESDYVVAYQVQYCTNKKFKKVKKTNSPLPLDLRTKINKKKTYYVRVRPYLFTEDGKVYGEWSKAKKCMWTGNKKYLKVLEEIEDYIQ